MKTKQLLSFIIIVVCLIRLAGFAAAQENKAACSDQLKIEIKNVEAQKTLVVKAEVPTSEIGQKMGELYGKLFAFMGQKQIQPAGPPFAVYYAFDPNGNTVFEAGVPVSAKTETDGEIVYKEFETMRVVSTLYVGPYEKMEPIYVSLQKFITDNNLKDKGIAWEVYLTDPMEETDPDKYQTIIHFPVE